MGQEYPRVGQDAPNRFLIVAYLSPKRRTWLSVPDFEVMYNCSETIGNYSEYYQS